MGRQMQIIVFLLIILPRSLISGPIIFLQARPLLKDKNYPVLIDDKIFDSHDVHVLQLYLMVNLAERCLEKDPINRDTMEYVSSDNSFSNNYHFRIKCILVKLSCLL